MKEVERKQNSTSALIAEDDQVDEVTLGGISDSEMETNHLHPRKAGPEIVPASTAAQREYASAMKVIGTSSLRRSAALGNPAVPSKRSRPQPSALILEDEVEDDWLEKDLPSPPTRKFTKKSINSPWQDREKKPVNKLSLSGRSKSSGTTPAQRSPVSRLDSDDDDDFVHAEEAPPSAKRAKPSPTLLVSDDSNDRVPSPILSGPKRPKRPIQLSMDVFTDVVPKKPSVQPPPTPPPPRQPPISTPVESSAGVLKLYVRVQDKVLLIPVERNKTVQWLSEEAARRYYNMTGN